MKKVLTIITIFSLILLITSACGKNIKVETTEQINKGIEFYKKYNTAINEISMKSNSFAVNEDIYAKIINDVSFGKDYISINYYLKKNGIKSVIGGTNIKINADDKNAVVHIKLSTPGEYEIVVFSERKENVIIKGELKVTPVKDE